MKTYDLVKQILTDYPNTRNSDKDLIWKFWKEEGFVLFDQISFYEFKKSTSPESICRARRKVQELWPQLEPTNPKVRRMRRFKEDTKGTFIYRENYEQNKFL
jgi:hypothetical protein